MQTCDTLLHAGVLLTQDDDRRVLENAALGIDGGRIVALGYSQDVTAAWQAREILDLSGMLVMPGLVNAHTHAAMTFLRGLADDMPLMDWLQQKIFPVEQGLTPDLVRLGSLLGFAEMLREATSLPVTLWDERRTTVDAHNILLNNGKRAKERKKTVDAVAASLMLEGYLTFKKRQG